MFDSKETQYQALSKWLTYRLDGWRTHRDMTELESLRSLDL